MRRALVLAAITLAAGALTLVSCNGPQPAACPGDRVATLQLRGDRAGSDAGCLFASDAGLAVTATLSYTEDGGAALCLNRAEAQPLVGTRTGDHVAVGSPPAPASVSACPCPVQVTETVEGDVVRTDGGAVAGFTGELHDALAPADGGDTNGCNVTSADGGQSCNVPCEVRWQLSTSP